MTKISVVIPVYNAEEYLAKCIESVLMQNNVLIEILLINDGSTDKSESLCDEFAKKDKRIKVFHQYNEGVSTARNRGMVNATGEWICFVDSDDWVEANSFEKILSVDNDNNADIIIGRSFINMNGNLIDERYPFNKDWIGDVFEGPKLGIYKGYLRGSVCGAFFRRSFLKTYNIFFPVNLKNGEDSLFFSLCTIYAQKISFANVHFYNIFEREGSASRSWDYKRVEEMLNGLSVIDDYIKTNMLNNDQLEILNIKAYGIISNTMYQFFDLNSLKRYFELRAKIKNSPMYPIKRLRVRQFKEKVIVLNFSFNLFCIPFLLRRLYRKIKRKCEYHK